MEHYRSTLATTALAVFGLVTAAHILHPGNYERPQRPRPAAASAAGPAAWVDPPVAPRVAAVKARAAEIAAAGPALLAPRASPALAPGARMAPTLASALEKPEPALAGTLAPQAGAVRKAAVAQRRRAAQRIARTRQAALAARAPAEQAAERSAQAPAKVDPIGDLIRGLGLGGEG